MDDNDLRRAQITAMIDDIRVGSIALAALGVDNVGDRTEALDIIRRIEERVQGGDPTKGMRRHPGMR